MPPKAPAKKKEIYAQSVPTVIMEQIQQEVKNQINPPEPEPVVIKEPLPDPPQPQSIIPSEINLEAYLKLYEQMLQYKMETVNLKKRLMEYEVKEAQKQKYNTNAVDVKDRLITLLLESDLNIEAIPDDVERQIYRTILDTLDTGITTATKCCSIM